jgi:MoxR-like ATPase
MAKKRSIDNVNVSMFTALKVSEKSKVPVLFMGNPGCGKSTSVYMFAEVRGYEVVMLRGNSETPDSIMGYDVAPTDLKYGESKSALHLRPSWFEKILRLEEEGKKVLLFLDEITTANEFVQSSLLHLIFERKCGEEFLPESTLIVAAGNYSGNISSTMSLMAPVMNRFMIFNIEIMSKDLDVFFNKYSKSKSNEETLQMMKELDKQERDFSNEILINIGEVVETAIKETTKMLIDTDKRLDLNIKDLDGIYSNESDEKLYGFVTPRTLVYLREVAINWYKCFGIAGVSSTNFKNALDGLAGIGLSRDKKKGNGNGVVFNNVSNDYFNSIQVVINDIDKLNSGVLSDYIKFFDGCTNSKTVKKGYTFEEVIAIKEKLSQLMSDKEVSNIERPIDVNLLKDLLASLKSTATNSIGSKYVVANGGEIASANEISGDVINWNNIVSLLKDIKSLINDDDKKYTITNVSDQFNDVLKGIRSIGIQLRAFRKSKIVNDGASSNIIPEVNQLDLIMNSAD